MSFVNTTVHQNFVSQCEKAVKGLVQYYKMDEAVARDIMSVKESYIMATFNTIPSRYGTIDAYLEKVIGLSREKRELLQ